MIILETGGLYAFLDADDADHQAARAAVDSDPGPFILSPFVLAELDYLVQRRLGVAAECQLLDDVDAGAGAYTLVAFSDDDMSQAATVVKTYADLGVGLTDASVVVIASRFARSTCSAPISATSGRSGRCEVVTRSASCRTTSNRPPITQVRPGAAEPRPGRGRGRRPAGRPPPHRW